MLKLIKYNLDYRTRSFDSTSCSRYLNRIAAFIAAQHFYTIVFYTIRGILSLAFEIQSKNMQESICLTFEWVICINFAVHWFEAEKNRWSISRFTRAERSASEGLARRRQGRNTFRDSSASSRRYPGTRGERGRVGGDYFVRWRNSRTTVTTTTTPGEDIPTRTRSVSQFRLSPTTPLRSRRRPRRAI